MHSRTTAALVLAASLTAGASTVNAQQEPAAPPMQHWSFSGPFGVYDTQQLQRGFKIYRKVCSYCHSLKLLSFRNLADPGGPGFSEAQAAAIAATFKVTDGPDDQGKKRPGKISDYFPPPFPNDQAARAQLGGGLPPDMSDLAKARSYDEGFPWFIIDAFTMYQEQGPDYIHAIINGYTAAPAGFPLPPGTDYNKYFPGHAIKMPPPLHDRDVQYTDGTPETLDQYGRDIAAFLMWASEPKLVERKRLGLQVMIFLVVFTGLLYFTKKRLWHAVEQHPEVERPRAPTEYQR